MTAPTTKPAGTNPASGLTDTDLVAEKPVQAPPTRGAGARVLLGVGVTVGLLGFAWGGFQLADLASTSTTRATASYDAAGATPVRVVELVADGDVSVEGVAPGGGPGATSIEVLRTERSGFSSPRFEVEQDDDRLVVTDRCDGWISSVCQGSLDVRVPEGTRVLVHTSGGEVVASGSLGDADLSTGNGRIDVRDLDGDLFAHTGNGEMDVAGVSGDADLGTDNGKIAVEEVSGDVVARSGNGDVTVVGDGRPVALAMTTSNGERVVEGPVDPSAGRTVVIDSSNGRVSYLAP